MLQNEIETVAMTHAGYLDLVSDVTRISVASSPDFQKLLSLRDERIAATPMGSNMPYPSR
jgi:hypothetical protein